MTLKQLKKAIALIKAGWEPDPKSKRFTPGAYPHWVAPDGRRMSFTQAMKEIEKAAEKAEGENDNA